MPWKERKKERKRRRIIIIIRNGAKTISLQTLFGRLNYHTITVTNLKCEYNVVNIRQTPTEGRRLTWTLHR